jgi:hypothetical protein
MSSQVFPPYANTLATTSLFLGAALPLALMVTGSQVTNSSANTKVDVPLDQPVPFSHRHHATELGIDCRFCHSTVETNAHASVPSTEVCMTCHSQIWTNSPNLAPIRDSWETNTPIQWNKVNAVPDFVYFNHSVHVNRGVSCNHCHGAIQDMPITAKGNSFRMAWCLECHRQPEKYLYSSEEVEKGAQTPRQQVFELYRKISNGQKLTDQEYKLAQGAGQRMPEDEVHEKSGLKALKERGVVNNSKQLADCYVCHR